MTFCKNQSPRVDPDKCRICADCCKDYRIWYPDPLPQYVADQAIGILYRDGMNSRLIPAKHNGESGFWLIIDHPCRFLSSVKIRTGIYREDYTELYSCELIGLPQRPVSCSLFPYPNTSREECRFLLD